MACSRFRTALSARADGEALPPDVTDSAVEAHLAACQACRRWAEGVRRLREITLRGGDGDAEEAGDTGNLLATVRAVLDGRGGEEPGGRGGTRAG